MLDLRVREYVGRVNAERARKNAVTSFYAAEMSAEELQKWVWFRPRGS